MDLEKLQAELHSTTQALFTAEKSLEQTLTQLEDHKLFIHDHIEAESKFHSEVDMVLGMLADTMQDISGLHDKISTICSYPSHLQRETTTTKSRQ